MNKLTMVQNQGFTPTTVDTVKGKNGSGLIGVVAVILAVIIAVGVVVPYSPTNSPNESRIIWAAGTFQMMPGYGSGSNGSGPIPTSDGQGFLVFSNMTDIHVYGNFTSNESISVGIGSAGPWVLHFSGGIATPGGIDPVWSSGVTMGSSISVSLPTPHNSENDDLYFITFTMVKPILTEVNVTSAIVLTYYSSSGQSTNRTILIASENNPLPKAVPSITSSGIQIYGNDMISILYGGGITLSLEMYNAGNSPFIENVDNLWPVTSELVRGPTGSFKTTPGYYSCEGYYYPYGFVVFKGNVSNATKTNAAPLDLIEPGAIACPLILTFDNYTINPHSDKAMLYGSNSAFLFNLTLLSAITFSGYYTLGHTSANSTPNQSYQFNYFPQGYYTIVVEDEWGAIAFLHFRVS